MQEKTEPKAYLMWVALLVGGLMLLGVLAPSRWPFILLMTILCLGIVIGFLYLNDQDLVGYVMSLFKKEKPIQLVPMTSQRMTNYTKRDFEAFKKEISQWMGSTTDEAYSRKAAGAYSHILIDNSSRMQYFNKYTSGGADLELEEPKLRKEISFSAPIVEAPEEPQKRYEPKVVSFEIGSQVRNGADSDYDLSFTEKDSSYRRKRIEELAEYIQTGIMTSERLLKENRVDYAEPRRHVPIAPVPTTASLAPKPQADKPVIPPGLLELKSKQQKDNILIPSIVPKEKPVAPEPEKPKISSFKPLGANLSTITEVQEDSMLGGSKLFGDSKMFGESKQQPAKETSTLFDSMAIETFDGKDTIASAQKTVAIPEVKQPTGLGIFGQSTLGSSLNNQPQPSRPTTTVTPRTVGGSLELKNPTETLNKNKELYLAVATHAKGVIGNPTKTTKAELSLIKEIVRNFLRDFCSAIDDHFLGECQKIIMELNRRKHNEDEYLAFCYELVTQFVLEFIGLMSSNKIKIVGQSNLDLRRSHLPDPLHLSPFHHRAHRSSRFQKVSLAER